MADKSSHIKASNDFAILFVNCSMLKVYSFIKGSTLTALHFIAALKQGTDCWTVVGLILIDICERVENRKEGRWQVLWCFQFCKISILNYFCGYRLEGLLSGWWKFASSCLYSDSLLMKSRVLSKSWLINFSTSTQFCSVLCRIICKIFRINWDPNSVITRSISFKMRFCWQNWAKNETFCLPHHFMGTGSI